MFFETGSHVPQDVLKLYILRLSLNFGFSCLHLLSTGVTRMHYHTGLCGTRDKLRISCMPDRHWTTKPHPSSRKPFPSLKHSLENYELVTPCSHSTMLNCHVICELESRHVLTASRSTIMVSVSDLHPIFLSDSGDWLATLRLGEVLQRNSDVEHIDSSGACVSQFCKQQKLKESQSYSGHPERHTSFIMQLQLIKVSLRSI